MKKARIQIVEDEAIIAIEIESQLQSLGYEVTSKVDTGEKAIAKAEEDHPDLILMDIRIKGEMDGVDAAEEIRKRFGIPVIFSTAYLDEERIERAKITMPFGYVLKPIQERDLKVTIEMALYVSKVDVVRKKVEEESQRSEELLNATQEMAKIGGWEMDLERHVTYWTDELYRIHDLQTDRFTAIDENDDEQGQNLKSDEFTSVDEAIKLSVECYAPKDQQRLTDAFKDCQEKAQAYDFELPFTSMKGHQKWIRTITVPVKENNKVVKVKGFLQDITDHKQAEEAQRESEKFYRQLMDSTSDGYFNHNLATDEVFYGRRCEEMLGYALGEIKHHLSSWQSLLHPDDIPEIEKKVADLIEGKVERFVQEYRFRNKTESWQWLLSRAKIVEWDENGKATRLVGTHQDITRRKQAEEQIKANLKEKETLLQQLKDEIKNHKKTEAKLRSSQKLLTEMGTIAKIGGWEVDLETMTPTWTDETKKIYDVDEVPPVEEGIKFYSPESLPIIQKAFEKMIAEGEAYDYELQLITAKGQNKWVRTIGTPVYNETGKIIKAIGMIQDTTEGKKRKNR